MTLLNQVSNTVAFLSDHGIFCCEGPSGLVEVHGSADLTALVLEILRAQSDFHVTEAAKDGSSRLAFVGIRIVESRPVTPEQPSLKSVVEQILNSHAMQVVVGFDEEGQEIHYQVKHTATSATDDPDMVFIKIDDGNVDRNMSQKVAKLIEENNPALAATLSSDDDNHPYVVVQPFFSKTCALPTNPSRLPPAQVPMGL